MLWILTCFHRRLTLTASSAKTLVLVPIWWSSVRSGPYRPHLLIQAFAKAAARCLNYICLVGKGPLEKTAQSGEGTGFAGQSYHNRFCGISDSILSECN
jgi:hypothetical protein